MASVNITSCIPSSPASSDIEAVAVDLPRTQSGSASVDGARPNVVFAGGESLSASADETPPTTSLLPPLGRRRMN
eukprot:11174017-Lingulodinium_polyedra.AAC.1